MIRPADALGQVAGRRERGRPLVGGVNRFQEGPLEEELLREEIVADRLPALASGGFDADIDVSGTPMEHWDEVKWLEFGVESIYDDTLRRVNRGHDYAAFLRAIEMTRGRSIHIGAHLILGFPWETREQWLAMADEMSRVGIDALKIHHLHIVRGTALAAEYTRQPFRVLGYEEYLDLLCDFLERLDSAYSLYESGTPEEKRDLVSLVTSNWTVKGKEVDFTPLPEAQLVAERSKDLYCRPYRDRPRTWDALLLALLKAFCPERLEQ